ncbi:hypothetical protein CEXT_72861 [Caerostris extrusa]|uniref:Uncharacterized protein n=1 Tax=Caerostris extrusa TaxID=172846 RepID=A0AAV4S451_CAEEX|nr:hypothetical protein CEXT_72861 [Caerostris extrusa]
MHDLPIIIDTFLGWRGCPSSRRLGTHAIWEISRVAQEVVGPSRRWFSPGALITRELIIGPRGRTHQQNQSVRSQLDFRFIFNSHFSLCEFSRCYFLSDFQRFQ